MATDDGRKQIIDLLRELGVTHQDIAEYNKRFEKAMRTHTPNSRFMLVGQLLEILRDNDVYDAEFSDKISIQYGLDNALVTLFTEGTSFNHEFLNQIANMVNDIDIAMAPGNMVNITFGISNIFDYKL